MEINKNHVLVGDMMNKKIKEYLVVCVLICFLVIGIYNPFSQNDSRYIIRDDIVMYPNTVEGWKLITIVGTMILVV